jgi:exopolyphosphatase/guanosine-5'-triphosphate,3'-diphosphate pyrophosphatase
VARVRCACIDVGSNTTRLLVADCDGRNVSPVHEHRHFTRVIEALDSDGMICPAKLSEVADVVASLGRVAGELGAQAIHVVATAAIRRAGNGSLLTAAVRERCELRLRILDEHEEARLAFLGAACTLGRPAAEPLAVIDVGGGSTEIAIGSAPDQVRFSASLALGSGLLLERWHRADPPSSVDLELAQAHVRAELERLALPPCAEALAVGGSATSLRHLAGQTLDRSTIDRLLGRLLSRPSAVLAGDLGLEPNRVRLLPGGLVILRALVERLRSPLEIGRGGMREGVLLAALAP